MLVLLAKDEILKLYFFYQDIQIEKNQIKAIYYWPEPPSIYDIQVFFKICQLLLIIHLEIY